jgi:hypothetical protein
MQPNAATVKSFKTVSSPKVLRVKKTGLFDVFFGDGWKEHSRVHWNGKEVEVTSGLKLTRYQRYLVESEITRLVTKGNTK